MAKPKVWFEIYQDSKKEWRWRLVARNKKILADSGEGYKRRAGATQSIDRLRIYMIAYEEPGIEIEYT